MIEPLGRHSNQKPSESSRQNREGEEVTETDDRAETR